MKIRAMYSTLLILFCLGMQIERWIEPPVHAHIRSLAGHRRAVQPFHALHPFDFLTKFLPRWQTKPPEPPKPVRPQRPFDPNNPAGIRDSFDIFKKSRPEIYRASMMLWRRELGRRMAEVGKSLRAAQASSDYIYLGTEKETTNQWNPRMPQSFGPQPPAASSRPGMDPLGDGWLSSGRIGGGDANQD